MATHDSETPANGQQVITANALLHLQVDGVARIFLPKRAATKKFFPGVYELPGGHIDFGEDIVEGLKREIKEELGIRIKVGDPFAAFTYSNPIKGSHSIEVVYFAVSEDPIEDIKIDLDDHSEYIWASEEELDKLEHISPEERRNVKKAFSLLKGEKLNFS